MRISPRLLATLALALAACDAPPAASAQQNARGVLFAVQRGENGQGVLEPVAVMVRDGFMMPMHEPSDSVAAAFNARWLPEGRAYPVLSRGERIGSVTVGPSEAGGCFGVTARGTLALQRPAGEEWEGLAGSGLPEQADAPWLRAVSAAEKRDLDRMAAALFSAHGIDVAGRTGDTLAAALVGHPNARPVLVASYWLQAASPVTRRAALLVIAEDGQAGYRPAYAWFHEGVEASVETRTLVDAADLDGDGQPELVVRTTYYESWDFTIFRRTEHGWMPVYRGGGGGC